MTLFNTVQTLVTPPHATQPLLSLRALGWIIKEAGNYIQKHHAKKIILSKYYACTYKGCQDKIR